MKRIALVLMMINILSCNDNDIRSRLIGEWVFGNNEGYKIEFTESGSYYIYHDGQNLNAYPDFDSLTYMINESSYASELLIKDEKGELFSRSQIQLQGDNELVVVGFKKGENIHHHIDEFSVYHRVGSQLNSDKIRKIDRVVKYIVPKNFRGNILIIHDVDDGMKKEFDGNGNEIFRIPENGILKTKSATHPFCLATGNVSVYEAEEIGELKELNIWKGVSSDFDEEKVFVRIDGYNQLARYMVNDQLNFTTDKNILFITVDTLRQLNHTGVADYFYNSFPSN